MRNELSLTYFVLLYHHCYKRLLLFFFIHNISVVDSDINIWRTVCLKKQIYRSWKQTRKQCPNSYLSSQSVSEFQKIDVNLLNDFDHIKFII
jgi:hypothetical protein